MTHVARRTKYVVYRNRFLERLMKYDKIFNKESFQVMVFGKPFGQKSAEARAVNCTILAWILVYKFSSVSRKNEKRSQEPQCPLLLHPC